MRRVMLVVGVAVLVGCGGVSEEKYNAKNAEAAKYQQTLQDETNKVSALEAKVASLEQQSAKLQSENATLQSQAASLQTQAKELEGKLGESTAATTALEEKTPLKLSEKLLFKENSSTLTAESKRALDTMAEAMAQSKDKSILVAGYTDDKEGGTKGVETKRWQLSSARALEVAKYLAGRGLDPTKIAVIGFGQGRPIAPNDSLANRAMNRRVEIALTTANMNMRTIELKPAELTPTK